MRTVAVDGLLALAVLSAWLGCVGFLRLASALDRLHCAAFVTAAAAPCITLAALLQDGLSGRAGKTVALLVIMLVGGAATTHAVGRALLLRGGDKR